MAGVVEHAPLAGAVVVLLAARVDAIARLLPGAAGVPYATVLAVTDAGSVTVHG